MAFLFVDSLPQNNSRVLKNSIKALELLLLSLGLISILVMVKGAVNVPYSCEIVFSSLLGFWTSIRCILSSPLYICIIINFMVLLIAASSALHRHENEPDNHHDEIIKASFDHDMQNDVSPPPPAQPSPERDVNKKAAPPPPPEAAPPPPPPPKGCQQNPITKNPNSNPTKGIEKSTKNLSKNEEKEEEEDTMEATWKAITGGGDRKPKKKHLKKSETWDVPPRNTTTLDGSQPSTPSWKEMRKSETFNDAVSITRRGGLRRDPSMSIDEFNKQVEAFIKKFNDNMRLQRQESDQRFMDMVNRGL